MYRDGDIGVGVFRLRGTTAAAPLPRGVFPISFPPGGELATTALAVNISQVLPPSRFTSLFLQPPTRSGHLLPLSCPRARYSAPESGSIRTRARESPGSVSCGNLKFVLPPCCRCCCCSRAAPPTMRLEHFFLPFSLLRAFEQDAKINTKIKYSIRRL